MRDYTLLVEESRTARVKHRCVHCAEAIPKGILYVYTSGFYDGRMQTDHWHAECRAAVLQEFKTASAWDQWEPGAYQRGTTKWK